MKKNHYNFEKDFENIINENIKDNLKDINKWMSEMNEGKIMIIKLNLDDKDWAVLKELAKIEGKSVQEFTNDAVKDYLRRKSPV
ncbi:MAG TPA: hypothetical protein P5107_02255 [Thermotogota bacterium]|nr:hypothetical protein [Thermotogota bacterium]HRW33859.1 hypothetical protein [Thermotogota bacterium]